MQAPIMEELEVFNRGVTFKLVFGINNCWLTESRIGERLDWRKVEGQRNSPGGRIREV